MKLDKRERSEKPYRPCAAMILFNHAGKVLVAERNDREDSAWQLPQGGIDEGESIEIAALRELEEEIGTAAAEIITIAEKTVCYDWPSTNGSDRRMKWQGQRMSLVALRFTGQDSDINLNTAHPEFRSWRWVALEVIPELIVPFKKPVYDYAVQEFTKIRDELRSENT